MKMSLIDVIINRTSYTEMTSNNSSNVHELVLNSVLLNRHLTKAFLNACSGADVTNSIIMSFGL